MAWVAVAGAVGGAVVGGLFSDSAADTQADAATSAANTSADASRYSADLQKQVYDQTRTDQEPWRTAGTNALAQMAGGMGSTGMNGELTRSFGINDFNQDPGYKFRMDEGMKAMDRSAAAKGGLQSGAALKAAARYGQDYASGEYQNAYNRYQSNQTNRFNRLASVAGVGQTANNALQGAGQNYANGAGSAMMSGAGDAATAQLMGGMGRASAYQSLGNNIGSTLSNPTVTNALSSWWNSPVSGDAYNGSTNAYYVN